MTDKERTQKLLAIVKDVIAATAVYLPPDGISAKDCISRILTVTDNADVVALLAEINDGCVARIARGLTDREVRALKSLPRIGGNNPGREYMSLLDYGLADCTIKGDEDGERWFVWPLELGLSVRRYLEENPDAG